MQAIFAILSLLALASAQQPRPAIYARQMFSNSSTSSISSSTTSTTTTLLVENPQTTFGAAAAQIQSAIAQGLADKQATLTTSTTSTMTTAPSPIVTSTPVQVAQTVQTTEIVAASPAAGAVIQPDAETVILASTITAVANVAPSTTFVAQPAPTGAPVGSGGTTTIDGSLFTTTVVAAYVTVAAQPTTFYENGIAYVASYAGETITVSDCPCTRSARIVFSTTTVCSACVAGTAVAPSATSAAGSVATVNGMPVVFAAGSGASRPEVLTRAAGVTLGLAALSLVFIFS